MPHFEGDPVKKSTTVLACAATLLVSGSAAWAAGHFNFHPGNWEVSVTSAMEGQPPMQPMTSTRCEKAQDVSTPEAMIAKMQKSGMCQASDVKATTDKASWTFTCKNGAKGAGELVYAGDSYESTMHMSLVTKKGPMKMTQHIKGKRIGNC
jgi:hypothetical protein